MRHIAMDIGGSLIKLVYFSPEDEDESSDAIESDESPPGSGRNSSQEDNSFSRTLAQFEQSPAAAALVPPALRDAHTQPAALDSYQSVPNAHSAGLAQAQTPDGSSAAVRQPDPAHNGVPATPPQQPTNSHKPPQSSKADAQSNHTLPSRLSQQSLGAASEKAARGGRLHFVKFETRNIEDAIGFIEQKQLLRSRSTNGEAVAPLQARPSPPLQQ